MKYNPLATKCVFYVWLSMTGAACQWAWHQGVIGGLAGQRFEGPRPYLFVYLRVSRTDGAFRRGKLPLAFPPFPTAAHWTLQADVNWVVLMPSNCKYCFMSDWLHPTDPSPAPFEPQPLLRPPLGIYADKLTRINIYVKQKGPLKSAGGRNVCENPSAYGPYRTHGWLFKRKRHQEKMWPFIILK